MPHDVVVNVNTRCRVRLTESGRATLLQHWQYAPGISVGEATKGADTYNPGWRDGEFGFQLWDLMNIFGPRMDMGNGLVFEGNKVIIEADGWSRT